MSAGVLAVDRSADGICRSTRAYDACSAYGEWNATYYSSRMTPKQHTPKQPAVPKYPCHPWLNANLVGMGYPGDDASRTWADSRRQHPWQPSEQDPRRDGYGNQSDSYGAPGGYDHTVGGFGDNDWYGDNRVRETRQQPVLDDRQYGAAYPGYEEAAYPGYENVDDRPGGHRSQPAYDDYDDYADFTPGYDVRPAPTTSNPAYTEPAPTTGNPVYSPDEPGPPGPPGEFREFGTGIRPAGRRPPPPRARPGGPRGSGSTRKKMILGVSAFCLVGALSLIYFLLIKPGDEQATANAPLPGPGSSSSATAACVQKYGPYCHITYRSDDPKPLSISELFPKAVYNEKDRVSFQQIGTRTDKTCSNAVLGSSLQNALGSSCSQALRASYTSGSGSSEIMGTIGVFNLSKASQAHSAGKLVGKNDFISPLATSSGVGANLGQSTGVMQSVYKGHYLILTWAELANEATPTNSDNQKLQQFENDLIASTANIALSQRMVTGKPGGNSA